MAKERILVQFDPPELQRLRELARESNISMAELVRRAVKLFEKANLTVRNAQREK